MESEMIGDKVLSSITDSNKTLLITNTRWNPVLPTIFVARFLRT